MTFAETQFSAARGVQGYLWMAKCINVSCRSRFRENESDAPSRVSGKTSHRPDFACCAVD